MFDKVIHLLSFSILFSSLSIPPDFCMYFSWDLENRPLDWLAIFTMLDFFCIAFFCLSVLFRMIAPLNSTICFDFSLCIGICMHVLFPFFNFSIPTIRRFFPLISAIPSLINKGRCFLIVSGDTPTSLATERYVQL